MIGALRRALLALLGGQPPARPPAEVERSREPSERLDSAQQRLKETISPPQDD